VNEVKALLSLGRKLAAEPAYGKFLAQKMLWVRDREGVARRLKANAAQRAFEANRGRSNIVLKARQMGITTWVSGRFFLKTITGTGVLTVQVAHTQPAAEAIFTVVERMWANLPLPLREGPLRRSRANVGQMVFPELDSEFRVVGAGTGGAGRGLTIQNLHCSEVSRWPGDAAETLAGLRAALAPGGEEVLESTPCGAYGCFYEEWMGAAEIGTVQHFFPWWLEPAYAAEPPQNELTAAELELARMHGLTAAQIGFRRGLERSFRGLREQEFAEDAMGCFKASGDCCFEVVSIERRLAEAPRALETRRGGALQVWLPAVRGKEYLVAVDTAGGGSDGDFAAVQVIELATGLQCAELRERLGTLELARVSAALAREYGGALLCVERNNHGAGVLAYIDSVERYACVYEHGGVAGWLTSAGSKPRMVSRMGALLAEAPGMFMSRRLLEECRTFVNGPGGKTGAAPGAHDDCLMAMAVAQAVRAERLGRS
jgi:hypothetical protein